jgi:uncharacterized protein involved in exopolysaccharide biosynthesis/Mrp family chromosome partitioning ATPase
MLANTYPSITPREIARVLFRYRRRMALFFCAMVLATLATIALYPRGYSSESKLFLRVGRESVALDPTATTGQTIMMQKTQVDEVNSAMQVLLSRDAFQKTVEKVGAERIVDDLPPAGPGDIVASQSGWKQSFRDVKNWAGRRVSDWMAGLHLSDPGTPEEMAIRKLDSKVNATAPKESTVITISFEAASPQLAQEVVQTLTEVFLEEHVRLNRSEGSLKFFAEQADQLQKQLTEAQNKLRDRKNEFVVSTIESRRAVFSRQLEDVELQRLAAGRELASSDAQIANLKQAIGSLQPELVTNRVAGFANEAKDAMREKLYELEIEESKLKAKYSDSHPLLEQIQLQRKEAQEILKDIPDQRTQTTAALNPNQRSLELELLQAQAQREAVHARSVAAQQQYVQLKKELASLNQNEVELTDLKRDVEILDGKYRMHVDKLEQARVNDEIGREKLSNVKVAQPATFVGKPISPKKTLLLACGLMFAVCGSLGLALVSELADQTLRSTEQIEHQLGLPVLLSYPYRRGEQLRSKAATDSRYRLLARELLHPGGNNQAAARAVGVIGCETTNARSRVASELAIQAADCAAAPVLLIDADDRRRNVSRRFGLNGSPGWREVVRGGVDLQSCIHEADAGKLSVMTPGEQKAKPAGNSSGAGGPSRLDELKQAYGLVIIDLPPAAELSSPPAAGWLDETVLVVEAERTRIQSAQRAKTLLERSGVRVAGVVLANRRDHVPRWLYDRL